MITREGKLELFDQFEVDWNLPKFRRPPKNSGDDSEEDSGITFGSSSRRMVRRQSLSDNLTITGIAPAWTVGNITLPVVTPWYRRWFNALFGKKAPAPVPEGDMSIDEFFTNVRNSTEELKLVETRLAGYKKALADAEQNGQVALCEKLAKDVEAVRAETQLHAIDQTRFVSEENLVRFVKETKRGLRLDYVRNFLRIIPEEASKKKARCDALGLFDNYAVLHHDPDGKSWAETEAEKERRTQKDPILFGLISGRRRLYFVADWVDEFCDLTLEEVADLLGKGGIENISAEYPQETAP